MEMPPHVGPFRLIRELGRGGMGGVFLAEDPRLGRKVALKLLLPSRQEGSEGTARLLREARAAAKLEHPNVCAIFEVGESESGAYIAMQYVEGATMDALLARSRPSLREVVSWGVQVADALSEAHRHGIVHRDIKPQNLMVTTRGQVKVLDFGLAKVMPQAQATPQTLLTQEGIVMGTVPYMSPEQVKGEALDGRSDLFSLGAVLFEAATGRRPFPAANSAELMSEILLKDPFEEAGEHLPPGLRAILAMAMAKRPQERYAHAEAMASDLRLLQAFTDDSSGHSGGGLPAWASASGSRPLPGLRPPSTAFSGDLPTGPASSISRPSPSSAPVRPWWRAPWFMGAVLFALGGPTAYFALPALLAKRSALDSIAVLPILNVSHTPEADHLCEGLTQGLIGELARHPRLKVIGHASAAQATIKDQDPRRIGRELGVGTVLQTRLRLEGSQLELDVELVDARSLQRLWGQRYTGRSVDLWTLQENLLKDLAAARLPDLSRYRPPRDPRAVSGDAYELYLKGNAALFKFTPKAIHEAFAYYDAALSRSPQFAEPMAAKAQGFFYLSGYYMPHVEALSQVKKCSMEALRVDPSLPQAQSLLAYSMAVLDHDCSGAEIRYRKAVQAFPGSPRVHQDYGTFLASLGRREEAKTQFDIALRLDPVSSDLHGWAAVSLILGRNPEEAIRHCEIALRIDPEAWFPKALSAWASGTKGDWEKASHELHKVRDDKNTTILLYQGLAAGHLGRRPEAEAIAHRLAQPEGPGGPSSCFSAACIHFAMGDREKGFALLERAIQDREENVLLLKSMPELDPLRGDDRYKRLVALAGQ